MISNATIRSILRWIHIILSIPIAGYIYGEPAEVQQYAERCAVCLLSRNSSYGTLDVERSCRSTTVFETGGLGSVASGYGGAFSWCRDIVFFGESACSQRARLGRVEKVPPQPSVRNESIVANVFMVASLERNLLLLN